MCVMLVGISFGLTLPLGDLEIYSEIGKPGKIMTSLPK
jgi:hypothetical protein